VLVMDEATASVDHATDANIQQMVKSDFKGNVTVITIAQRISSILDADRILVLDGGQLVEQGAPRELLASPRSRFRQLVGA